MDPTPTLQDSAATGSDRRGDERRQSTARTLAATVIVIAILYTARQVLIPVALAILFAFLLKPVVTALEKRRVGRKFAVAVVLALAIAVLSLGAWSLILQVNSLAREVVQYSGNLERKLTFLKRGSIGPYSIVERTLERLTKTVERVEKPDMQVRVLPDPKPFSERWHKVGLTIEYVASAFLIFVLVYFLLIDREQLRDKLLRIAGRAHLTVTTQAIGETGHRISRYIFMQAMINAAFGLLIGVGLFFMGIPHSLLWGVLAATLRFVPYVGAILSGAMPFLMAAAVFPGWWKALGVLALFLFIDQLLAGFIEPAIIGHRVGVSPIALLITAIFWGWLWGPVGLLLATPITVCLTVAGEFIPAMRIFSILLGTESPLEDYLSFYNRLLLRDRAGAAAIADRFAGESSTEDAFNELFEPTLTFASEELQRKRITRAHDHFIKDTIRELIIRLGDRNAHIEPTNRRIVAASVGGERLSLGTLMLTQLIRSDGWPVDYFTDLSEEELLEYITEERPQALIASCSSPVRLDDGVKLLRVVRKAFPNLAIVASGSAFVHNSDLAMKSGATFVPPSVADAHRAFDAIVRAR